MKARHLIILCLALSVVTAALGHAWILRELGRWLIVDENVERADAAISGALWDKAMQWRLQGKCGKIIVINRVEAQENWRVLQSLLTEESERARLAANGLDDKDLLWISVYTGSYKEYAEFLRHLLRQENIQSAVFFVPYHKTRKYRIYLDHYLGKDSSRIFIKPMEMEADYPRELDRWWENTVLANYFLEEYLGIFFYYFNLFLRSPAV